MRKVPWRWMWLLVGCVLAACATTLPSGSESFDNDVGEVVSFEDACADESSLLALCAGRQCGMYPCREVVQHLAAGKVVPAWAEVEPLAEVGGGAQRYWGSAQDSPWDSRPVFIIPWNNHKAPLLPSQQKELEEEEIFRYAGQLIYEFELFGPVVPYWKKLPQPLPPGYQGP